MLKNLKKARQEIKVNQTQLNRYREYYIDTQWANIYDAKDRQEVQKAVFIMLKAQVKMLENILKMLEEEDYKDKEVKEFIDTVVSLVEEFSEDSKRYIDTMPWNIDASRLPLSIESPHEEMAFQTNLIRNRLELEEKIASMNLKGEVENILVPTYGGQKIPICVRDMIVEFYPNINEYIKTRKKRK